VEQQDSRESRLASHMTSSRFIGTSHEVMKQYL